MQRREHKMPGLGDGERGLDRLQVAHFTDQDDVRVLAQHILERGREGRRVGADLALVDDALLVVMDVLDRILDRHDVGLAGRVDLVEHRRECRALAAAGRAGQQHQALLAVGEFLHDGRQPELLHRQDVERNLADRHRDHAALHVDVRSVARQTLDAEGEVELLGGLVFLALVVRHHAVGE